jgi:PhoPQ-activated pathogenicity-related protein
MTYSGLLSLSGQPVWANKSYPCVIRNSAVIHVQETLIWHRQQCPQISQFGRSKGKSVTFYSTVQRVRFSLPVLFAGVILTMGGNLSAHEEAAPSAIFSFMEQPEPAFAWNILSDDVIENSRVLQLKVTSQEWHGIVWEHGVEIFEPAKLTYPKHALLFVTGGAQPPKAASEDTVRMGIQLAAAAGMRVVILHQVPNQPTLGGRKEDDAITETWLRYLKDGDETWPLLFPMVKSAVKTMDAVQELSREKFSQPIESFIITGASKRGWTSWLTPVVDDRIIATAPIVIDVLNFRAQMTHQKQAWGKYSEQIIDYTSKGLIVEGEENTRERHLRRMMDPYSYREQLTLPKFLVNGTNDPYWVVDSMKLYWDDLKGPKYALFIPNAGHGLDDGREKALTSIAAFARIAASGRELPELTWSFSRDADTRSLSVNSSRAPEAARFWSADSTDLDFRDERWASVPMRQHEGAWVAEMAFQPGTNAAVYADLEFEIDGVPYSLCTLVTRD